ncbi:hypothetical protein [Acanthamoeba polyphaga mimivirus]|uniref:Uncharacterized protein n=1 Tax=Acanthamoeba polyphaga mimivirus TaxID=212035 RepID=A0A0G2Y0N0_MIMIV|nr:hypothetical protein [Acanthamoeba castellanii mamavirus]AKI79190.1 hypothetical protein [Acanthamoeba polyphaga mimivirus]EJN40860.1 hypothetical protein lvs_R356 [Acanthamoeba polyphaga lentillevirus]UMZ08059.1 hypothetical protein [Acanthamoeba polyphaga mimivirus]
MELPNRYSDLFVTEKARDFWCFTRNSMLYYILLRSRNLNNILDEYIQCMNQFCGFYSMRIPKNKYNDQILTYSYPHLRSFEEICLDNVDKNYISTGDFKEMRIFYEQLLKFVDKCIGRKYKYGHKFNLIENNKIHQIAKEKTSKLLDKCPYNNVYVKIPKNVFNTEQYKEKNIVNTRYINDKNNIILMFNNNHNKFTFLTLWNITECIDSFSYFRIVKCIDQDDTVSIEYID